MKQNIMTLGRLGLLLTGFCLVLGFGQAALAGNETPYLYHRAPGDNGPKLNIELESAYGSREAGPVGDKGYEQILRLRYDIGSRFFVSGQGGLLFDDKGYKAPSGGGEVGVKALVQELHQINFTLAAGYLYDYQGVHVPRLRVGLGRRFGDFDLVLHALLEFPQSSSTHRDTVDLISGLAMSYRVNSWFSPGLEILMQDIEGFWEKEEAEGGAKLLVGPTLGFKPWQELSLKLNAAAIIPGSKNSAKPGQPALKNDYGFLGRLVLGYGFL